MNFDVNQKEYKIFNAFCDQCGVNLENPFGKEAVEKANKISISTTRETDVFLAKMLGFPFITKALKETYKGEYPNIIRETEICTALKKLLSEAKNKYCNNVFLTTLITKYLHTAWNQESRFNQDDGIKCISYRYFPNAKYKHSVVPVIVAELNNHTTIDINRRTFLKWLRHWYNYISSVCAKGTVTTCITYLVLDLEYDATITNIS